jgi:hypothetical protein
MKLRKSQLGFGGASAPTAQPVPINPMDDTEAVRKRQEAETAALADSKARGRASTVVAGRAIAEEEQRGRGLLKSKQRSAVASELGI